MTWKKRLLIVLGCGWFLAVNVFLIIVGNVLLHKHAWVLLEEKSAACEQLGFQRFVCECGEEKTKIIAVLGHTLYTIEGKQASCEEDGWKSYQRCSNCAYSTYERIETSGHHWQEQDGVWICGNCEAEKEEEFIEEVHVHTYERITIQKDPTCTQNGTASYVCECGESGVISVAKLGHKKGDGDCLSGFACQRCAYLYILPKPHDYKNNVCKVCGDKKTIIEENNSSNSIVDSSSNSTSTPNDSTSTGNNDTGVFDDENGDGNTTEDPPVIDENVLAFEELVDGNYKCVGFAQGKHSETVVIPDEYNGKKVVEIASNAFKNDMQIQQITLGRNIKSIGELAFYGCKNLKTIYNNSTLQLEQGTASHGCIAVYAENIYNGEE